MTLVDKLFGIGLLAFFMFPVQIASAQGGYTVKNETGKPMCLLDITGDDGKKKGEVCITGAEATFGFQQNITKGVGYAQAVAGDSINVVFTGVCKNATDGSNTYPQAQLTCGRIEWDEQGNTTAVRDIGPTLRTHTGEELKITSDLHSPLVKSGVIQLSIQGKGTIPFVIRFGGRGGGIQRSPGLCALFDLKESTK